MLTVSKNWKKYLDYREFIMSQKEKGLFFLCCLALLLPYAIGILADAIFFPLLAGIVLGSLISYRQKKSLQWLPYLLLVLLPSSLMLTGVDLWARKSLQSVLYYRPHEMFIHRFPRYAKLSRYKPLVEYKGNAIGDMAAMSGNPIYHQKREIVFLTDKHGFRNSPSPEKKFTVIALGDSYTMGSGTTQDKIWPERLKSEHKIATYNLALPGSPWHQFLDLSIEIDRIPLDFSPTLVWTIFGGNDLDDRYGPLELKEIPWNNTWKSAFVSYSSFRKRSPIAQICDRLFSSSSSASQKVIISDFTEQEKILFYLPYIERAERTFPQCQEHPDYLSLIKTIQAAKKLTQKHGIDLLIVNVPYKSEVYSHLLPQRKFSPGFAQALQEITQKEKISFLDLTPIFQKKAQEAYKKDKNCLWWRDDTHWNEKGHEVALEAIVESLALGKE